MKLAFVFTNFPVNQVSNIDRMLALTQRGHEIKIFAASHKRGSFVDDLAEKYALQNEICYYGRPSLLKAFFLCIGDFLYHPRKTILRSRLALNKKYIPRHGRIMIKGTRFFRMDKLLILRRPFLKNYFLVRAFENYEYIQVFNIFTGPLANKMLFLKKLYPQAKLTATFVGYDFSSRIRIYGPSYYQQLYSLADAILAKSIYSKNIHIELNCDESKIFLNRNKVFLDKYPFIERNTYKGNTLNVLMIGRLINKKGFDFAIRALIHLINDGYKIQTTIVGDGPLMNDLQKLVPVTITDNFKFMGKVKNDVINTIMSQNHILLVPSHSDILFGEEEDTPTVITEALSTGMPVLGSSHAGIPELVDHGKTGLIFAERNSTELKKAILQLYDNPDLYSFMISAIKSMRDKLDISSCAIELEEIYIKLGVTPD